MVATHTVKINGVLYRAGEVIPSPDEKPVIKPVTADEPTEDKAYTKSDIITMRAADLRKLATENGIERPDELTGTELKKMLVEKLGL